MPFGEIHFFLRKVASLALAGFFREIHIIGEENVPLDGPVIVCCTHHNMMIDPGILGMSPLLFLRDTSYDVLSTTLRDNIVIFSLEMGKDADFYFPT
jgi:hypothetical protein